MFDVEFEQPAAGCGEGPEDRQGPEHVEPAGRFLSTSKRAWAEVFPTIVSRSWRNKMSSFGRNWSAVSRSSIVTTALLSSKRCEVRDSAYRTVKHSTTGNLLYSLSYIDGDGYGNGCLLKLRLVELPSSPEGTGALICEDKA